MINKNMYWWSNRYDYSQNELAELKINNPRLYREIVESNLSKFDSVEKWEQRNLDWAKECLLPTDQFPELY